MSELTFEQMLDESFKTIHNGEVVDGTVIDVKPDEIILNIGYKADGIITRSEYTNDNSVDLTTVVSVGDPMTVKVLKVNDGEGQVLLTYKRLVAEKGNERLKEAFENKEVLKAPVTQILGGGLSVVSSMGDFTFMEGEKAELFVNSPNAINENRKEVCDSASAKFQSESGTVDFVGTESEIFEGIRDLVSILPSNNEKADYEEECEDDLNRACEGMENCVEDTLIAISNISDNGYVFEVKKTYAPEMLTAFIKVNGATVGVVANRTKVYDDDMNVAAEYEAKLTVGGCKKAAEFVEFCDAFGIAILTLTNVDGFKATMCQEKHGAKATAKLVYAFANATVPKVNILIGNAMGSAYVAMNSKAIGADVVYAWPTAKVGMMDAKSAVQIMYADEIEKADDASVIINEKTKEYNELQSNVMSAAARGYVDSIIEPVDTRKYVIGAFEMLYTKYENRPGKKHGTV